MSETPQERDEQWKSKILMGDYKSTARGGKTLPEAKKLEKTLGIWSGEYALKKQERSPMNGKVCIVQALYQRALDARLQLCSHVIS